MPNSGDNEYFYSKPFAIRLILPCVKIFLRFLTLREFINPFFHSVHMVARNLRWTARSYIALVKTKLGVFFPQKQKPHGLAHKLIISLTSYKPRFKTLDLTLECILNQTVKPDRILLWVDEPDVPFIPEKILAMKSRGLEICVTDKNLGPFNKIVYTLRKYSGAAIVTVDDDTYYRRDMVEHLLSRWSGNIKEIVCNMAVTIKEGEDGGKTLFNDWPVVKGDSYPRYDIMPFGVGGVLYPPGSLPPETTDESVFTGLCPRADDIWLFWMARRNGVVYRKVGGQPWVVSWPSSQNVGLRFENHVNNTNGNDRQTFAMVGKFGWPAFDKAA
jgi:hypothetical protein